MTGFGHAAFIGLCLGLIWGVGCSLVLLYSAYLAGYRQAVKESLAPNPSGRFTKTLQAVRSKATGAL
jgi:hypothetical protein